MEWYRIYQEVCNEIEFLGFRIDDLESEYEFWYRSCNTGGRKPIAPLDSIIKRMNKICEDVREYAMLKEMKENTLEQLDKQLQSLDNREIEVVRLSVFEGMKLRHVAKEMGLSEIWVKQLSARAMKKLAI